MQDFVEAPFDVPGDDARRLRKMLRIHPLRPIPAKLVKKYRTIWSMLAHVNKGAFERSDLAVLTAQVCVVEMGTLDGKKVVLVDGKDLSTEPPKSQDAEKRIAEEEVRRKAEVEEAACRKAEKEAAKSPAGV